MEWRLYDELLFWLRARAPVDDALCYVMPHKVSSQTESVLCLRDATQTESVMSEGGGGGETGG